MYGSYIYRLPEYVILNREPQFVVELIKELNSMLEIETRFLIVFYLQTDRQTEQMNHELEQYLRFFINYRQKNWPEQLTIAGFVVNNKVHMTTKASPFIINNRRKLKIEMYIRRKERVEKVMEFAVRTRQVQKETKTVLRRVQEEIKQ